MFFSPKDQSQQVAAYMRQSVFSQSLECNCHIRNVVLTTLDAVLKARISFSLSFFYTHTHCYWLFYVDSLLTWLLQLFKSVFSHKSRLLTCLITAQHCAIMTWASNSCYRFVSCLLSTYQIPLLDWDLVTVRVTGE